MYPDGGFQYVPDALWCGAVGGLCSIVGGMTDSYEPPEDNSCVIQSLGAFIQTPHPSLDLDVRSSMNHDESRYESMTSMSIYLQHSRLGHLNDPSPGAQVMWARKPRNPTLCAWFLF